MKKTAFFSLLVVFLLACVIVFISCGSASDTSDTTSSDTASDTDSLSATDTSWEDDIMPQEPTVVYVKNGADGDGSTADSPLGSLTKAYESIANNAGEIIIIGRVSLPNNAPKGKAAAFVEPEHESKITIRGYDGTSELSFDSAHQFHLSGDTEIKELIIQSTSYSGGNDICARGYHLTMGEGLSMRSNGTISGEVGTMVFVYGGFRDGFELEGKDDDSYHVTVKSGSYWIINGFNRNLPVCSDVKSTIEIGGDVYTRYLGGGSCGSGTFEHSASVDIQILGDLTVSYQISLGNLNSDTDLLSAAVVLKDGSIDHKGSVIDYNSRLRVSNVEIYVNENSDSAKETYSKLFEGYGDIEGTLSDYCKNKLGGHSFDGDSCSECAKERSALSCTEHDYTVKQSGSITTYTCKNCDLTAKTTSKTSYSQQKVYTYRNGKLRVQILSDSIIRIEQSKLGVFTDKATLVVPDRTQFAGARVVEDSDGDTVILKTEQYTVNIPKNSESASSVRIFSNDGAELYGYFKNEKLGFYASLPAPADTPDAVAICDNGIIPADGGLTYVDNLSANSGWTRTDNTDMYVILSMGDARALRSDFVQLTGRSNLSEIKTLGIWWSKWTRYSDEQRLAIIEKYRSLGLPLDIMIVDTEWKATSANGNDGDGTGYDINTAYYPNMKQFLSDAESLGVHILFNDHTHQTSQTITTPAELKWQSEGIKSLLKLGLDGWWYDRNWKYAIKSPYREVMYSTIGQVHYYDTMSNYNTEAAKEHANRVLMLTNADWVKHGFISGDPSIIGHRYGVQWTGDIYADARSLKRELEIAVIAGTNGASPYISADLGGHFSSQLISESMFLRWMQYGIFSTTYRIHSSLEVTNEKHPYSYSNEALEIVRDYFDMRYHLLPYYYSLSREAYDTGMPLMRRLDFYYPEEEKAQDNTQYMLGDDILVAPQWSTNGSGFDIVPANWLKTNDGEQGLTAKYRNYQKGSSQAMYHAGAVIYTEVVDDIEFYWYSNAPKPGVNADYFSATFEGKITPEFDCYIGTLADDGARVYIDGSLWSNGYAVSELKPGVNTSEYLRAGKTYNIKIEYYELTGKAALQLVYEPVVGANMSQRSVFIPEGTWINVFTGEQITGPKTITVTDGKDTMPIYVRKGAIIPSVDTVLSISGADWKKLSLNIYDLGTDEYTLYEDDGMTEAYKDGEYAKTDISISPAGEKTWRIDIGASEGGFDYSYSKRTVKIRVHSDTPIKSATANGKNAAVTVIKQDTSALPFANEGASNISDVYEITLTVDIAKGTTVTLVTE